jgi:signal transduction histidine kinase
VFRVARLCQHPAMSRRNDIVLTVAVVAFALITTAVGAASGAPVRFLVADLVTGFTFIVAGATARLLRPASPAGGVLLTCGALWYVGSYGPTNQPIVTHLGFAFGGYYDLLLAGLVLVLSSPAQRLEPRWPVALLATAMAGRTLGRLLLADPSLYPECAGCPPNPFALRPDRAAYESVEVVGSLAIAVLAVGVAWVAVRRLSRSGALGRRARGAVLVAGGLAMAAAAYDALDMAWATATATPLVTLPEPLDEVFEWSVFALRTLVPVAFLVATLRSRSLAGPLGPFAANLGRSDDATAAGDAVRTALGDPSLRLLRPRGPGVWLDEDGGAADPHESAPGQAVTFVGSDERPLGALRHDAALLDQPELLEAVVRVLRLALENERLEAELRDQLQAVTESRARIVTAAEEERRRLERDLHDGAQQRLIGLTLALQEAREAAGPDAGSADLRRHLDAAATETAEAIHELRELARGIHPAILEDEGLGPAVTALARRAGLPVDVRLDLDGRLPRQAESTAYFTVAEALTNTQRHAGATRATVRLSHADGTLELEVTDDGQGGAEPARGSGLRGLADRVTALDGSFDVRSEPGRGTTVRASFPVR